MFARQLDSPNAKIPDQAGRGFLHRVSAGCWALRRAAIYALDLFLNKKSGVFQAVFGAGNGGR